MANWPRRRARKRAPGPVAGLRSVLGSSCFVECCPPEAAEQRQSIREITRGLGKWRCERRIFDVPPWGRVRDGDRAGVGGADGENMAYHVHQSPVRRESILDEEYQVDQVFDPTVGPVAVVAGQCVE